MYVGKAGDPQNSGFGTIIYQAAGTLLNPEKDYVAGYYVE